MRAPFGFATTLEARRLDLNDSAELLPVIQRFVWRPQSTGDTIQKCNSGYWESLVGLALAYTGRRQTTAAD
jgi:hypothetical protein